MDKENKQQASVNETREREAFERYWKDSYSIIDVPDILLRRADGKYFYDDVRNEWQGWLASAARQNDGGVAKENERLKAYIKDVIYYIKNGESNERGLRMMPMLEAAHAALEGRE